MGEVQRDPRLFRGRSLRLEVNEVKRAQSLKWRFLSVSVVVEKGVTGGGGGETSERTTTIGGSDSKKSLGGHL